jgi:hypothetical protein
MRASDIERILPAAQQTSTRGPARNDWTTRDQATRAACVYHHWVKRGEGVPEYLPDPIPPLFAGMRVLLLESVVGFVARHHPAPWEFLDLG